jgi:hypothetical protein
MLVESSDDPGKVTKATGSLASISTGEKRNAGVPG